MLFRNKYHVKAGSNKNYVLPLDLDLPEKENSRLSPPKHDLWKKVPSNLEAEDDDSQDQNFFPGTLQFQVPYDMSFRGCLVGLGSNPHEVIVTSNIQPYQTQRPRD